MNRLRELRQFYNDRHPNQTLTQADVARHIGLTRQGYAKIESGKTRPDVFTAIKIARLFKQKVDSIFVVST